MSRKSIQTVRVIDTVRGQKDRYVRSPTRLGEELSGRLVFDAFVAGARRVLVEKVDRWWVIGSPFDWFAGVPGSTEELFHRIVSTPHVGDNTHRHEIVVAAFANAVVVYRDASLQWQQGSVGDLSALESFVKVHMPDWRVVAFACSP